MKNIILLSLFAFLSISSFSQSEVEDCTECTDNCITIGFFGDNLPDNAALWTTYHYTNPYEGCDAPPCDPYVDVKHWAGTELNTDKHFCLPDSCYTLVLQGVSSGTFVSGVSLTLGDETHNVTPEVVYSFTGAETMVIEFAFVDGEFMAYCPVCNEIAEENDCPTDLNEDGQTNVVDVLAVLSAFNTTCSEIELPATALPDTRSIEQLIDNSNLKSIQFKGDYISLIEPVNYWIISSNGQVVENKRSNEIDLSRLSTGVYIFMTETEIRKFVID